MIQYDVATALWQGRRPYQEDTLLADFHGGMARGFAVLADGMGGHAAGDLASRLVVIDAVSHLKFLMHDAEALENNLQAELTSAIKAANDVLKDRADADSRLSGMGSTFLATVMFEDRLYWASVGDSPLYLWREGDLRQINEDHSMAPVIDQMAEAGEITAEEAANHPDRNALTSVLMGSRIKSMDVPRVGMVLDPGDVLIQASDGLQYLDDARMSEVLGQGEGSSREIADRLMAALRDLDDPAQDNTAILVLQLTGTGTGGGGGGAKAVVSGEAPVPVVARAPSATSMTQTPAPSRRWVAPVALLGAALAVGLIFGLPREQTGPEIIAAERAILTPTPAPDVPPEADIAADTGDVEEHEAAGAIAPTALEGSTPLVVAPAAEEAAEEAVLPEPTADLPTKIAGARAPAADVGQASLTGEGTGVAPLVEAPAPGQGASLLPSGSTETSASPLSEELNAPDAGSSTQEVFPVVPDQSPRLPLIRDPDRVEGDVQPSGPIRNRPLPGQNSTQTQRLDP